MRHAMIMAGGSGTRLWPMSRGSTPKQLIGLFSGKSLLEIAAERLDGVVEPSGQWICAGQQHAELKFVRRSKVTRFTQLLGEPEGRDTLNAVGFTAAVLHSNSTPKPCSLFSPPTTLFARKTNSHAASTLVFGLVEERRIPLCDIRDYANDSPLQGMDMSNLEIAIGEGAYACDRFVEKPDVETATKYLASGNFAWNSGMFVFHAGTFLRNPCNGCNPSPQAGLSKHR